MSISIQQASRQLLFQLYHIYDEREAANISDWVMEHLTGWKKIDRVINKQVPLSEHSLSRLQQYTKQLLDHRPVQYVLGEAWFYGLKFFVNEEVLIPRPETEELVDWILTDMRTKQLQSARLMDIGTGSGCIPVTVKKHMEAASVSAIDISESALAVADQNAKANDTAIEWLQLDILDSNAWSELTELDIIVSNPPYIPLTEKQAMAEHVINYEPHMALFVTDEDPLVFYKAIAELALEKLAENGAVYLELNERYGDETAKIFLQKNFQEVILKKDMQGKNRMLRAIR